MKTTLLAVAILVGSTCTAQIGLITLPKNAKEVPIGQWYTYRFKLWDNNVTFLNTNDLVNEKLSEILKENDLFFEEYKIDEFGDKYWVADKTNGFQSHIYLIQDEEGWSRITVYTDF
jgi:hypothetical protein